MIAFTSNKISGELLNHCVQKLTIYPQVIFKVEECILQTSPQAK